MGRWEQFLMLTRGTIDGLAYGWPITLALLVGIVVTATRGRPRDSDWYSPKLLWQLLPVLFLVVFLALGSWFACNHCSQSGGLGQQHVRAIWAVDRLLAFQLVAAVGLIWISSPVRLLSALFQLLLLWCSYWAAFMARVTIAGGWP